MGFRVAERCSENENDNELIFCIIHKWAVGMADEYEEEGEMNQHNSNCIVSSKSNLGWRTGVRVHVNNGYE